MRESKSNEELWDNIKKDPWYIEKIEDQDEDMCLYCVKNAWNTLKLIKEPSHNVIKEALIAKGWAIQFVKNPSEELQLLAVQSDWDSIQYIKNPFESVKIKAVEVNWKAINYIRDTTINMERAAVKQNAEAIMYINDITEDKKRIFIKDNVNSIKYLNLDNTDAIEEILKEKISDENIDKQYITDFLKLKYLDINKTKLVYKYGSKKAKMYFVDFKLSV